MDLQFAFANPRRKKKKRLAKKSSSRKLKLSKNPRKSRGYMKKKHKKHARKNPMRFYARKKTAEGKTYRDVSGSFPLKKEVLKKVARAEKALAAEKKALEKYKAAPSSSKERSSLLKQYAKAKKKSKSLFDEYQKSEAGHASGIKTLKNYLQEGWKVSSKKWAEGSLEKKPRKKKIKSKSKPKSKKRKLKKLPLTAAQPKEKSMAKRKRRKSAKRKHSRRKKAKSLKKHLAKSSKPKRHKRRSKKSHRRSKRRYAKRVTHSHSKKVLHVRKGSSLKGYLRKGKRKIGTIRIKFNPFGGKMDQQLKDWTGLAVEDASSLALGGLLYGTVNNLVRKYVPQVAQYTDKVPVVGPALLPLLLGALIHKYGRKYHKVVGMVGEGLVGASVVGAAVSASSLIPGLSTMSGVSYFPMSGVKYFPRNMSGVDYTPNSVSGVPQLGANPDFGKPADYGGGAGYTEAHKFSSADFGRSDDDLDSDEEYVGLGNLAESVMG